MRKTAKSIIATLLTLVMLMTSFVIFGVSGTAAETQESYQFNPTTLYCYNYGTNNGSLAKMNGNDFTTVSEKTTATANAISAFFNDEGMQKIAPYTYADGVFTQVPSVRIGLSFTLSTTGSENLPYLRMRLAGRNATNSGTSYVENLLVFSGSSVTVLGTEICGYGDGQEHDIYLEFNITSFKVGSTDGSLTVAVFVGGEYLWEKTVSHSMYALKHDINENVFAFNGTCKQGGNDMSLKDLTCYVNMPKAKPLAGKAPTGVSNPVAYQFGNIKGVNMVGNTFVVGTDSDREGGVGVTAFFSGVSELFNLRNAFGTPADVSKLGMSFNLEGTASDSGKYPTYALRLYNGSNYNLGFLMFSEDGSIGLLRSSNKIADLKDGKVSIYLDMDIKWASVAAKEGGDGVLTVRAYVNGVYQGEYTSRHGMTEGKVGSSTDNVVQFYTAGTTPLTKDTGFCTLSNVEFYFDKLADSYEGASMRLVGGAETSGLRFELGVNKAFFDNFGGKATVGALIIPTDKLPGGHFSEVALEGLVAGKDYIVLDDCGFSENATEASENGDYVYYASIVGIKDKNMARSFTGVGYVKLADGRCVYTCQQNRSIYEVAKNATVSSDYEGTANEAKIDAYLDKVVVLKTEGDKMTLATFANYDSPYALDESTATTFVLSGAVEGITTIVVDGVVFTKGWDIADGKLSAALPSAE